MPTQYCKWAPRMKQSLFWCSFMFVSFSLMAYPIPQKGQWSVPWLTFGFSPRRARGEAGKANTSGSPQKPPLLWCFAFKPQSRGSSNCPPKKNLRAMLGMFALDTATERNLLSGTARKGKIGVGQRPSEALIRGSNSEAKCRRAWVFVNGSPFRIRGSQKETNLQGP